MAPCEFHQNKLPARIQHCLIGSKSRNILQRTKRTEHLFLIRLFLLLPGPRDAQGGRGLKQESGTGDNYSLLDP